jgi:hypothetical protein
MRILILALALAMLSVSGCVSAGSSSGSSPRPGRDVISREVLDSAPSISAYQAVERFHRDWLRGRSSTLQTESGRVFAVVFVDGQRYGPLDTLHQIGTEVVQEIRFISPSDATTRYGTGYPGGIIMVTLMREVTS